MDPGRREVFKEVISRTGVIVPPRVIHYANGILNYLAVGRWFHDRNLAIPARFQGRPPFFDHVAKQVPEPITYLEFGVFQGTSMRHWSSILAHPDSQLRGFDSFEGLPEQWSHTVDREFFDLKGRIPQFDDPRVKLYKGWFNDTVPPFAQDFHPHPSLIINVDCDLYTSTMVIFRAFRRFMKPGTILLMDDFFDREHGIKAFNELLDEDHVAVECIGATNALSQAAFRITSS